MAQLTKRRKRINEKVNSDAFYDPVEAIKLLKEVSQCKFDEVLEIAVELGIDARKGDQMVRGVIKLPGGSGKLVKLAVFADGAQAKEAMEAGADKVGMEDLAEPLRERGNKS